MYYLIPYRYKKQQQQQIKIKNKKEKQTITTTQSKYLATRRLIIYSGQPPISVHQNISRQKVIKVASYLLLF